MLAVRDHLNRTDRGIVMALPDSPVATAAVERLRLHGWRVVRAESCAEARRLACRLLPDAVVLPADGPGESGWLACAKLARAQPQLRVVLVGERSSRRVRFARFVEAAALVPATASGGELAARVEGAVPQTV